jgi:hypothetical protein
MGTRSFVKIFKGSKAIWFYNHCDGYPSVMGVHLLQMLKKMVEKYGMEGLQKKFDEIKIVRNLTEEDKITITKYLEENDAGLGWYPGINDVYDIETIIGMGIAQESYREREEYEYYVDLDKMTVHCDAEHTTRDTDDDEDDRDNYRGEDTNTRYSLSNLDEAIKEWSESA